MKGQQAIVPIDFPINMGEEQAFDWTFRIYHQPLKFFTAKFVGEDDAEDVVESMFLKLWRDNRPFESQEHLKAFLYHSARNACLNHLKVSKNAASRYQIVGREAPENEESCLHDIIRAEVLAEVYRAINNLPSQCSRVISMSYIEGLSNGEIARQMDLSEQTVKNYKLRGLKVLKGNLSGSAVIALMLMAAIR